MKNFNKVELVENSFEVLTESQMLEISGGETLWYWTTYYLRRVVEWEKNHFFTEYPAGVA